MEMVNLGLHNRFNGVIGLPPFLNLSLLMGCTVFAVHLIMIICLTQRHCLHPSPWD